MFQMNATLRVWIMLFVTTKLITSAQHIGRIDTTGLYFKHHNDILIEKSKCSVNYKISVKDLITQSFELKRIKLDILSICSNFNTKQTNCNYFIDFIESNERMISNELDNIRKASRRPKRCNTIMALVYIWIKTWLSGDNMDQKVIDELQNEDIKNREMIEEQVKISNLTLEINNKIFHNMGESILGLQKLIQNTRKAMTETQYLTGLSNAINFANMILAKHSQMLHSFTKLLSGEVDANIIDIIGKKTLVQNLTAIKAKKRENGLFPYEISEGNIFNILSISNVSVRFAEYDVYISLAIPLVKSHKFKHFQIMPIPKKINNTMIIIDNVAENIIINKETNEYVLLSDLEMNNCKSVEDNLKICTTTKPILSKPSCESEALLHDSSALCKTKQFLENDFINRIADNEFIISPFSDPEINIFCSNGSTSSTTITSESRIILEPGCSLENDEFRYIVEEEIVEDIELEFNIDNVTYISIGDVLTYLIDSTNDTNFVDNTDEYFANISSQLNALLIEAQRRPDRILVSNNGMTTIITLIVFAVVCYVIVRMIPCVIKKYCLP